MIFKRYLINVSCYNCNRVDVRTIPKGITILQWMKTDNAVCKFCGCKTLRLKTQDKIELF